MKSALCLLALVATFSSASTHNSKQEQKALKARTQVKKRHGMQDPRLKQFGYDFHIGAPDVGAQFASNFDLGLGYKVLWDTFEDQLIVNPEVFA